MKFYLHHIYLLLAIVALVVCMCSPALITFVYNDMSMVSMTNFALRSMAMGQVEPTSSAVSCALGVLLIVSALVGAFTMFVSLFQNFSLQKRSSIFNCCVLAGYYIIFLVFVLILRGDTRMVDLNWQVCLPLVSLILTAMSFYSIRTTEAKMLARANNFRLRD
ncbi:MAG: DUF4293 family protein [Bacteroidaceae bacterium]|nr:DUF4293 family protein [Bacteroidaceae bacterium]